VIDGDSPDMAEGSTGDQIAVIDDQGVDRSVELPHGFPTACGAGGSTAIITATGQKQQTTAHHQQ
jgi:sugar lactone lactonase YvrE